MQIPTGPLDVMEAQHDGELEKSKCQKPQKPQATQPNRKREAQLRGPQARSPLPGSDSHSVPPQHLLCQCPQLRPMTHLQRFDLLQRLQRLKEERAGLQRGMAELAVLSWDSARMPWSPSTTRML